MMRRGAIIAAVLPVLLAAFFIGTEIFTLQRSAFGNTVLVGFAGSALWAMFKFGNGRVD